MLILMIVTMLFSACRPVDAICPIVMNVDTLYFSQYVPFQVLAHITLVNNGEKSVFVKRNDLLITSLNTSYDNNFPANIIVNKYPIPQDSIEYGCYAFIKTGVGVDEYYKAFYAANDKVPHETINDETVYILEGKSKNKIRMVLRLKPFTTGVIRKLETAILHPKALSIKLQYSEQSFGEFRSLIVVDSCLTTMSNYF